MTKPNDPDDDGLGKEFLTTNADKDNADADILLAQVLSGTPTPVAGTGASPELQAEAILAEMESTPFAETEQGRAVLGEPTGQVVAAEDREQSDAELERIRDSKTWQQATIGENDIREILMSGLTLRHALLHRWVLGSCAAEVGPELSTYADELELAEKGMDTTIAQLGRVQDAFESSASAPTEALSELSEAYEELKKGVEKNWNGRALQKAATKCRKVVGRESENDGATNDAGADALAQEKQREARATALRALDALDPVLAQVEVWRAEALQPLLAQAQKLARASKDSRKRAADHEELLADLNQGQNSYAAEKASQSVNREHKYTRADETKATLDEVYDEALVDGPDPSRIDKKQVNVAELLGKEASGKGQTQYHPDKERAEALEALQSELHELLVELREAFPDGARDGLEDSAELNAFVERVMELVRAQPKLKDAALEALEGQLREGIVKIVLSNPELGQTGAVDPSFDEEKQARVRALIDKAKGDAHVSRLLFDLLDAGTNWAFGALHYVWKVNGNYEARTGGMDIFSFYKQQVVPYDFFKQVEIDVNKVGIPALQQAERNFASSLALAGVDHKLEISSSTRGFSFRSGRDEARGRNLKNPLARLSEHDLGLAVDVNYNRTARNPRVNEPPEIWEIVRMVVAEKDPSLQDVDPSVNLYEVPTDTAGPMLVTVLQASRDFSREYPRWCAKFAVRLGYEDDRRKLPPADEYEEYLKSEDRLDQSTLKEMDALASQRSKTQKKLTARRAELVRQHQHAHEAISKHLKPVLEELPSLSLGGAEGNAVRRNQGVELALSDWDEAAEHAQHLHKGTEADAEQALRELDAAATQSFSLLEGLRGELSRLALEACFNGWDESASLLSWSEKLAQIQDSDSKGKLAETLAKLDRRKASHDEQQQALSQLDAREAKLAQAHEPLAHLRVLRLHDKYRKYYEAWSSADSGVGFADFNPAFVLAMDKAGWRWGARFSKPDFHHFEYKT
ncbi:MAG: hypothetical protein RBU37_23160 [Myxococcota bacterium]|jgi:hypothetical protein|nr:hypothetical protein [Myxococcota bacterium]